MADQHLLDVTVDDVVKVPEQVKEKKTCEVELPSFPFPTSRDMYLVLLKHLESLAETNLAINDETNQLDVSGYNDIAIQHTLDNLSNLNTAFTLIQRFQENHHHHVFPPKGYTQLQMLPFGAHAAAATIQTLTTAEEWESVSSMAILVPLRSAPRKKPTPITPCPATLSRDWEDYNFQGFGNGKVLVANLPIGPASSSSSAISRVSQKLGTLSKLHPVGNLPLTAPERADRVKTWVNQSTDAEIDAAPIDSLDIQSLQPSLIDQPAEEQKNVPGLLKRRPKPKTHQIMAQQAASRISRATKQMTLEDCWLKSFASFKLGSKKIQSADSSQKLSPQQVEQPAAATVTEKVVAKVPKPLMKAIHRADAHEVEEIFDAMQPALEAAKCFPGKLELEVHVELIAVAPLSDYRNINKDISLDEWREFFQPQDTRPLASFWIWHKLTASGVDVDSVVDLEWSKKGAERMFEEQAADWGIAYEYHCRTKNGFAFVITLNEHGQASFQQAESALGSSTIHFPHRTWDLNLILKGAMNFYHHRQDPHLEATINDFVKSISLQSGNSLTIYCTEPANGLFSVEKILMKRWARHKHLPIDREVKSGLMLKVLEVQEFTTGRNPSHPTLVRGRIPILERQEWASKKRLWFEVSIVSDEIQKLLVSNQDLELGQKTRKWNPTDLLGEEIDLKNNPAKAYAVTLAVGNSGLGNMFRLGKSVLDRLKIGEHD
ncbi:hypothetical protein UA08_06103 [Talaromyces atroroseus]|uniref:Uncharacterized protein n=1 Tax=Talaromyces atroroseus TaxID=1441469 RepID=A0A225ABX4_TALAT|nr:hypothetical protein UA08_06103 [Talaromyces atroroseus]OKL58601.1 hypothetical protein UA08_06103 [Talaromyces atroroseus]